MRKVLAFVLALAGLSAGWMIAQAAIGRDREYRRLIVQGDEALSHGQAPLAVEAFSGAIALKPDSMLAYLKRGEAHQRLGNAAETLTAALRDLRTAALLDPGAPRAQEEIGDINFRLHRYGNAADSYESYLRVDDHSASVLYKLALASRANGRLTRAVWALQQSVALNPSFAEGYYLLGLCLKDRGQLREARSALDRAIRISPALIPVREELADVHRLQGRMREEIEQLEALAALDPSKADRWIAVGLAYLHSGAGDRAATALDRAAERFPQDPGVLKALAKVWLHSAQDRGEAADAQKALEALESMAHQSTATSETLGLYGRALLLLNRRQEAEQALKQAAERFPVDPGVLLDLSTVAQLLGHPHDARAALMQFSTLVDGDPEEGLHSARIADLSLQLNDPRTAVTWYRRSESAAPLDELLLTRLALARSLQAR